MADTFYELCNVTEIASAEALTIPRARALFNAIERHRDYSIVQLLQQTKDGAPTIECLIVDVECDGVPSKNQFGIAYRERLALCVPSDPKRLIDVLALRRDFPELMHLNQGLPGAPASLCLYFESPAAVLRTWTPPAFLRRIQWWLERSARGELHPADQPVEQMFFASQYELILPWNYAKLREDLSARFVVFKGPERPNGGFTCYMEAVSGAVADAKTAAHIDLLLPPVTHGFIEHNPGTLGELSDILGKRSVDLIGLLRDMIQTKVDEKGAIESPDDKATVIVVLIPIRRSAEADPDGIMRRAFFVPSGIVEVGIATGALFKYDGRYFRDSTNSEPTTAWRDLPVLLMDVLTKNDGASARRQSAVLEEGPTGVLVGAGSLGSALLNLWGRSGFGRWSVIDDDHIKPHNLSRHVAFAQHIGQAKATVVAELHDATMEGATRIAPITADASDFSQQPVAQVLNVASLVVDASTTLEYPRAASANDALPRHCSTFVTPDGNGAVLLMEDVKRSQRLRTLEAQYYREIIQSDWGKFHLGGQVRTFWSGASCRDISTVMPYSRVLGHASTLSEQIQATASTEEALIRVWQRDPKLGSVKVHDVPVMPEQRISSGDVDIFIDDAVKQQLRELRRQRLPNETGGVLLGYYDFNVKAVVIVMGLPAPPDSESHPDSFERGLSGLKEAVNEATARTAGMVGYIGEWHSHPPGHSALPSEHDLMQLIHLALGMADDGLPAIQLIVGEEDLRVLRLEAE